jgi:hypothetical protein
MLAHWVTTHLGDRPEHFISFETLTEQLARDNAEG